MRKSIEAARVRGVLVALIGALLLVAAPATAEAQSKPQGTRPEARLIAAGAGYSESGGSARVRALQRHLLRAGERPGPVDGLFGPLTEAAVRSFQSSHGLAVDGLVGPVTAKVVRGAAALIARGEGYGEPHGSKRVRTLQRHLLRAGERPGPVDGLFGPLTEAAVRSFQSSHGLAVDGLVGEATGGTLARRFAIAASVRHPGGSSRAEGPTATSRQGAQTQAKPTEEPEPTGVGDANPASTPDDPGIALSGWWVVLAVAAALALLFAGAPLALALGRRPARSRRAGAQSGSGLLTGPLRPHRSTPRARILGLRRPPAPEAGRPEWKRAARAPADLSKGTPLLGYSSVFGPDESVNWSEFREQEVLIAAECERRGFVLLEFVRDREPHRGKALERPGLGYALRRISAGEARGLAVFELSRLTRSVAELGMILESFIRADVQLVAVAEGLDTADRAGRLTARTLIEVSAWERERRRERSRDGLQAVRAGKDR